MSCISEGTIIRLLLAFSSEAENALSGASLDASSFEEVENAMPYPYYSEQAQPDEHGTSYSPSIAFSKSGEGKELSDFEGKYNNAELGALCILPNGQMRLFLHLSLSRQASTGQTPSDFNGRAYTLAGVSSEEGLWIDTLL